MIDLAHAVAGVRLASMMIWSLILFRTLPETWRCLGGQASMIDWKRMVLGMVGLGLAPFQGVALFVETQIPATRGILVANLVLLSAGVLALVVWSMRAPDGPRRAALVSHLAIVFLGVAAGICL